MTQYLPPNLLALFAPREPIPFKQPADKLPHEKKRPNYTGIAQFVNNFEDPKDTPPPPKVETKDERRERKKREKAELQAYKIEQGIALWNPAENLNATTDPYRTLFVGRINYETSESKLRREFEAYGPVKRIITTHDKKANKPRGYAFIEFERERDMHSAYKHADGRKIDGRRVLVDVERGRTVKGWLPRRLGGGLGNTRRTRPPADAGSDAGDERGRGGGGFGGAGGGDRRRSRSRERGGGGGVGGGNRFDNNRDRKRRSRSKDRNDVVKRHRGDDRRRSRERDRGSSDRRRSSRERPIDNRRERDVKREDSNDVKRESDSPSGYQNYENGGYQ